MRPLKNWDNKTWLSSKIYISHFHKFLRTKIKFKKHFAILDIGCGRGNITGNLQKRYKFKTKPIGIDIIKNKDINKNILFKKIDAKKFLIQNSKKYDLILIKQIMHLLDKNKRHSIIQLSKKKLKKNGVLLILFLSPFNTELPTFKKFSINLKKSLKKDKVVIKEIKRKLKNYKISYFNFKVRIKKLYYINMIRNRYISCLLNMSVLEIDNGVKEIEKKYKNNLVFTDKLLCIEYKKN